MNENVLTNLLQNKTLPSLREKIYVVWKLSIPAILAQLTEIILQYIDAAMVGSLGAAASASIGLVSSSTWLVGGLVSGTAAGFAVQVAHAVGGGRNDRARDILRQGLIVASCISLVICAAGLMVGPHLPQWLGASEEIRKTASAYFMIYAGFIPVRMMYFLNQNVLQCTGNMKTPSILTSLMAVMDVVYNFLLIFPTRTVTLFSFSFTVWGAGMGVAGAALGTALSFVTAAIPMVYFACIHSPILSLKNKGSWKPKKEIMKEAAVIGVPMALEHVALSGAQVFSTRIVAPLGTNAIAANSFAVTAEGLCYMPGYGIGSAATAIVGQSIGAERKDLAKSFAWLSTAVGMLVMGMTGVAMYFLCPYVFAFLTPVESVRALGESVLRIELIAEPMFAASIVASGCLRGAGDTLIPGIMNLCSIWGVRITLALLLVDTMGLHGVWTAMAAELTFRGVIYLIRLKNGRWLKQKEK